MQELKTGDYHGLAWPTQGVDEEDSYPLCVIAIFSSSGADIVDLALSL